MGSQHLQISRHLNLNVARFVKNSWCSILFMPKSNSKTELHASKSKLYAEKTRLYTNIFTFYTRVFSGHLHSMDTHLNATEVEDFPCARSKLLDLLEDLDLFDGCLLAPIVSKSANQTMARSPLVASLWLFLADLYVDSKTAVLTSLGEHIP